MRHLVCVVLLLVTRPGFASENAFVICFPHYPSFQVEDYLTYILRVVPLKQMRPAPLENKVYLQGHFDFNLQNVRPKLRPALRDALIEVFEGRRRVSGASLVFDPESIDLGDDDPEPNFAQVFEEKRAQVSSSGPVCENYLK